MAKQWRMVRLEAGLAEDLDVEIERLAETGGKGVSIGVERTDNNNRAHKGITVSDFVRRLLDKYTGERQRKDAYAERKKAKRRKQASK